MKLATALGLLFVALLACATGMGPGIAGSVRATTRQDPVTGQWTYTYEVSSSDSSTRGIDVVEIETPTRGALSNVRTPSGWTFYAASSEGSVSWARTDSAVAQIQPGRSLDGFAFESPYEPEAHRFALSNNEAPGPTPEELELFGDTVAPSSPCPAGTDPDGDGICGPADNCPNAANVEQRDRGGVATPLDPRGQTADGIGDACQCGDADNDGRVTAADAATLSACLTGGPACNGSLAALPGDLDKCDVGGPPVCEATDATTIERAVAGSGEPIRNTCVAFRGKPK